MPLSFVDGLADGRAWDPSDDIAKGNPVDWYLVSTPSQPMRVAAINFLNPAPLMWDFEHPPLASMLAQRYDVRYTQPSVCAAQLLSGEADLGLIPIAALTPDLAIVPGCTIASLHQVRSILLLVKHPHTIETVRTVAADTASRSSVAYTEVLFRKFLARSPDVVPQEADPIRMLQDVDAALLIGDPALMARENRAAIEDQVGPCLWIDLAAEWRRRTDLPWVAAVWAIRREALGRSGMTPSEIIHDLNESRDHGLAHIEDLVRAWTPRIALAPETIREYLTKNIHYVLDADCVRAIELFRRYAAEIGVLPPLPDLAFL